MIVDEVKADTINAYCTVCGSNIFVKNQGLGGAAVATWKTRHQHYEQTVEDWKNIDRGR